MSETTERQIEIILTSGSPDATRDIAARLGVCLRAGDVVALSGELGAGKTCFVQGLAKGMGLQANVTSPTFILIRQHPGDPALCHADAYRLESPEELEDLGLEDILAYSVLAIEWAERTGLMLPCHTPTARGGRSGSPAAASARRGSCGRPSSENSGH